MGGKEQNKRGVQGWGGVFDFKDGKGVQGGHAIGGKCRVVEIQETRKKVCLWGGQSKWGE